MSHNRPRTSLLNLFDPLNSPNAVATRDAPSPESDKENSNPTMGDLSAVFSRSYKTPQPTPTPPNLTRRLVDVGDATIDEIVDPLPKGDYTPEDDDDFGIDEDDENATLTFRAMATCLSPKSPEQKDSPAFTRSIMRAPLAELIIDEDITPIARNKTYKRHIPPPSSIVAVDAASSNNSMNGSALTSLVDEVNSLGVNFGSLNHQMPEAPEIRISLADDITPSIANLSLGSLRQMTSENPGLLSVADTTEFPTLLQHHRLRPGPQLAGSAHPNRTSVDLNSSFHVHLQSPETSFDLLNDKISFFAPDGSMESSLDSFDESFELDVEVAKMGDTLRKLSKHDPNEVVAGSPVDGISHASAATQDSDPSTSKSAPIPSAPAQTRVSRASSSNPFPAIAEELSPSSGLKPVQPAAAAPNHQPQDSVLSTPLSSRETHVAPPPPVPALRIVKRAKLFGFSKPQSAQDSASSTLLPPTRLAMALQTHAIESTKAIPSHGLTSSSSGPRRVLINGGVQKVPPPRENLSASKPASETTVKRNSGPGAPTLAKQTSTSGLRLPTKFTTSTFTSTLPRFNSSLPKPQAPVNESSKTKTSSSLPSRRLSVKRML